MIKYLAPPFRFTYFKGKQIVVHNSTPEHYEMISYNLYLGPSAKKCAYGFLLNEDEKISRVVAHSSAVKITPQGSKDGIILMHEGASGCG